MKQIMVQFAKIRKDKRISYLEIEKRTGIPFARMMQLETGDAAITVEELEALLDFYQLTFDQVRSYKRWNKLAIPTLATLVTGVLLFCAFYFFPDLVPVTQGFQNSGQAATQQPDASTPTEQESLELPDDAVPENLSPVVGEEQSEHPSTEPASSETAGTTAESEPAAPPADEPAESVVFRFWGNLPYHAERLPRAMEREDARVIDIFPIQYLDDNRPDWLEDKDRDRLILNAGTSEVWTPTTVEAYRALQEDQYQVLGLGKLPDVYEPLILEVNGKKIGFLSMAGLIRHAEEIALTSRVGLARAYRTDEVTEAVRNAKEKVDYLFVLVDWGKKHGQTPNTSQRLFGKTMIEAGADCVIGNRPHHAQDFILIDGKPLFYALGHSVSGDAGDGSYNLVVEARFSTRLDHLSVIVGKLQDGILDFPLTAEDRGRIEAKYADKSALPDHMSIIW